MCATALRAGSRSLQGGVADDVIFPIRIVGPSEMGLLHCYGDPYSRVDVSIEGRGGGVSDFTTIEGRSQNFSIFRSSLDQKEAIGAVFRSMHPPRAILEPRRVRWTLIPGSTLGHQPFS